MLFFKEINIGKLLLSVALTSVLLVACYFWENVPLAYGESFDKFYVAERCIQKHFGRNQTLDEGLFINVGYDKAVAEIDLYDMNGLFTGRVDITDRETLDNILARLEEDDTYKYIFLDVRFEKGITTPSDSVLFARIARMRDIVVATHRGMTLSSPVLEPKAYLSDYKTTITSTGFTRYQYLQKGETSVPLKIYEDLTGSSIRKARHFPIYYSGKSLCHNSVFVRIPEDFSRNLVDVHLDRHEEGVTGIHRQRYFDCGPQIDAFFPLDEQADGKIVIIGDYVNDMAGTYMGEQPNPYLAFLATENLLQGRHKVSVVYALFLAAFFLITFITILERRKSVIIAIMDLLAGLVKKLYLRIKPGKTIQKENISILGLFIWNLLGFSISTFLVCLLLFICLQATFSIFIPSLAFSITVAIIQTRDNLSQKTKGDETVQTS